MIIIQIMGGFANQLYEYLAAYALSLRHNCKITVLARTKDAMCDPYLLDELNLPSCKRVMICSLIENHDFLNEMLLKNTLVISEHNYDQALEHDILKQYKNIYMSGNFQKLKYIQDALINLKTKNIFNNTYFLEEFEKHKKGKISIAVHIRKGDFAAGNKSGQLSGFYKAAMLYLKECLNQDVYYYIFSDEIEEAKVQIGQEYNIFYVSAIGGNKAAIEEFIAIALCDHRILTRGSSYGRLADILGNKEGSIAVYYGEGKADDHFRYLGDRQITDLLNSYHVTKNNYNSAAGFKESLKNYQIRNKQDLKWTPLNFLQQKAQYLMDLGDYQSVQECYRKMWEYSDGNEEYHNVYRRILLKNGCREDSIIETARFHNLCIVEEDFLSEYNEDEKQQIKLFEDVYKNPIRIILIPYRPFSSYTFEHMLILGTLLRRLGNHVTIATKIQPPDMKDSIVENELMRNLTKLYDGRGNYYGCDIVKMDDLNSEYFNKINEKTFIFCKEKKYLSMAQENKNLCTVFWDFSDKYDVGNYYEVQENYVRNKMISNGEIEACYGMANYSITTDGTNEIAAVNKVLLEYNCQRYMQTDEKIKISEVYQVDKRIYKYLIDVTNKIFRQPTSGV